MQKTDKSPSPHLSFTTLVLAGVGDEMAVLVVKKGRSPGVEHYSLPTGEILPFEIPVMAAVNFIQSESGIDVAGQQALSLNPRGKKGREGEAWAITLPFLFWLDVPSPVGLSVEWIQLKNLQQLAFDHGGILCEGLAAFWPILPYSRPALIERGGKTLQKCGVFGGRTIFNKKNHYIFYGGSFNPWHQGHSACTQLCPRKNNLIIIPDSNPHKEKMLRETGCAWKVFSGLVQIKTVELANIYPGFVGQELSNPSVYWLKNFPFKFSLLMGDDSFLQLSTWKNPEGFLKSCQKIYIVPRLEDSEKIKAVSTWIKKDFPKLKLQKLRQHSYQNLSSTTLRSFQGSQIDSKKSQDET